MRLALRHGKECREGGQEGREEGREGSAGKGGMEEGSAVRKGREGRVSTEIAETDLVSTSLLWACI
jgi:hypothetical protein